MQQGAATPAANGDAPCSQAYHQALQSIGPDLSDSLDQALARLLEPDRPAQNVGAEHLSERRGPWTFYTRVRPTGIDRRITADGRVRPLQHRGQVCLAEAIAPDGRPRCQQWTRATPTLIEDLTLFRSDADPQPNRSERDDLSLLTDTLATNGRLSAFQDDGRFYWLVRRIVIEMKDYLAQPPTPSLCTGVPGMLKFYADQLAPMRERAAGIHSAELRARRRLADAAQRLHRLDAARLARQPASTPAMTSQSLAVDTEAQLARTIVSLVARLDAPLGVRWSGPAASAFTYPALRPRRHAIRSLERTPTLQDKLLRAREIVDRRPRLVSKARARRRAHIVVALRSAEAIATARRTAAIYDRFLDAVDGSVAAIRSEHLRTCTCAATSRRAR
ncbi:MAG: hypothetical protein ACFCUN_11450 [Hyphomicrobiaceae bacterium]